MKFRKEIKTILLLVFFFAAANGFAQIDEPDEGTGGDGTLDPAPIGDYILPMLLLGIGTAFVLLKRREAAKSL
jgi:hypothetical protein